MRLSQLDGSALWRVDRQVARVMIIPSGAEGEPLPVGSLPVEAHTKVPAGGPGRVLRIADAADPGWRATLDGRTLTPKTVDGWAQGFELPAEGGTLDLTYDTPLTHTAWIWAQSALAVVLLVLALPGRRREIDDDLPEEAVTVPAEPIAGEGRRARRLRAAAQAEAEAEQAGDERAEGTPEEAGQYIPAQQTGEYPPAEQTGQYPPADQPTEPQPHVSDDRTGYAPQADDQNAYAPQSDDQNAYTPQADHDQTGYTPQADQDQYAAVPQQQYGEWDAQQYQDMRLPAVPGRAVPGRPVRHAAGPPRRRPVPAERLRPVRLRRTAAVRPAGPGPGRVRPAGLVRPPGPLRAAGHTTGRAAGPVRPAEPRREPRPGPAPVADR